MTDFRQHIIDFQRKAKCLDKKARNISPRLFLFDVYCPKHIPTMVDSAPEVAFWYLIVDLYGLFFDAGGYFKYLDWDRDDYETVCAFYAALNEMRSVFCHNKPPTSYLPSLITKCCLGKLVPSWEMKSAAAKNLVKCDSEFPFARFFDIFPAAADGMLNLIDQKILNRFEQYTDDEIYEKWFKPIFDWWIDDPIVYTRAWLGICQSCGNGRNVAQKTCSEKEAEKFGKTSIKSRLNQRITNEGLFIKRCNYGYHMYHKYFSRDVATSERLNLTPRNLLEPLLMNLFCGTPFPKNLFDDPGSTAV